MPDITLTQIEADYLINLEKQRVDDKVWSFSGIADSMIIPLISSDRRENFILDIWRSGAISLKGSYQNRAHKSVILARLDFGGQPHRNPDDEEVPSPHLHIYRERYANKWAYPLPEDKFPNPKNLWITLTNFMVFCNCQFAEINLNS